jgi:hypothetical protein
MGRSKVDDMGRHYAIQDIATGCRKRSISWSAGSGRATR